MNVVEIMKFGFMFIRFVVFGFLVIVCIVWLSLVLCMSSSRLFIMMNVIVMIMIFVIEIMVLGVVLVVLIMLIGLVGSNCGNGSGLCDQMIIVVVCSRIDMLIVVISGVRCGVWCSGWYVMCLIVKLMNVQMIVVMFRLIVSVVMLLSLGKWFCSMVMVDSVIIVLIISMLLCVKLMMLRMLYIIVYFNVMMVYILLSISLLRICWMKIFI